MIKPGREYILIVCFSMLLILFSLYQLLGLLDFSYYCFMFQKLSPTLILLRYYFSIVSRTVLILAAIGLLFRQDTCRRLVIMFCVISLVAFYGKHPMSVFKNIAMRMEYVQGVNSLPLGTVMDENSLPIFPKDLGTYHLKFPAFPWISFFWHGLPDIIFCAFFIYFFTRPEMKKEFK